MEKMNQNIAVFTTTYVMKNKSPIIFVSHDEDGSWQFFSKEEASIEEAMLVALKEIIDMDPSIKQILHIPKGSTATRDDLMNSWKVSNL